MTTEMIEVQEKQSGLEARNDQEIINAKKGDELNGINYSITLCSKRRRTRR